MFLSAWAHAIPALSLLLAVLVIPGFVNLLFLRISPRWSLLLSPAWSLAIYGVSGVIFGALELPWNLWSVIAFTVGTWVFSALLGAVVVGKGATDPRHPDPWSRSSYLLLATGALIAFLALVLPVLAQVAPDTLNPNSDPMYHYNGARAVEMNENASMLGGMAGLYGILVKSITYPPAWAAVVALASTGSGVVVASHTLAYVLVPLLWVVGLALLGRVLFERRLAVAALVAPASLLFPVFPGYLTISTGFWPNSLALSILPTVMAFGVVVMRKVRLSDRRIGVGLRLALILLTAIAGASFAHPSVLFTLLWIGIPSAFVWVVGVLVRRIRHNADHKVTALISAGLILSALVALLFFQHPRVQQYMSRPFTREFTDVPRRLITSIILSSSGTNLVLNLGLAALILIALVWGAARAVRAGQGWMLAAWVAQWLAILGSLLPIGFFTRVAGIWYHDTYRLLAVQTIFASLLIALAMHHLFELLGNRFAPLRKPSAWGAYIGGAAVVIFAGSLVLRVPSIYSELGTAFGKTQAIQSQEELDLIKSLDEYVPPGAAILGDPTTGIGYAPAFGDVASVWSQINVRDLDTDGNYLARSFNEIHTSKRVCEVLNYYGIRYFYEDAPITFKDVDRREVMPGFYDVDTSGFTLLAQAGDAKLWEIDACQYDVPSLQRWNLYTRTRSYLETLTGNIPDNLPLQLRNGIHFVGPDIY